MPVDRTGRTREVPSGAQRTVGVDGERKLHQGSSCRAKDRFGSVEHIKGRLMTWTLQLVVDMVVQRHRASCVRAHPGVADETVRCPGGAPRQGSVKPGGQMDQSGLDFRGVGEAKGINHDDAVYGHVAHPHRNVV